MSTLPPTLETYMNTSQQSPLCAHITPENLSLFLSHANVKVQSFKKNSFIAIAGDPMEGIGILLEGRALLTRENMLGQRTIVTELEPSSMFGEALLFSNHPLWPATIEATKDAIVLFLPIETFTKAFPDCQTCQIQLLTNLMHDLSEKAMQLTRKVHYLSLKGMREKIFAYFMDLHRVQKKNILTLPHNRQEMADVLNVSRTALSRELGRLQDERIIQFHGKEVELVDIETIEDFSF